MESNLGSYLFVFYNHFSSCFDFACFDKILGRTDVDKVFRGQILGVQKKSANAFPIAYIMVVIIALVIAMIAFVITGLIPLAQV